MDKVRKLLRHLNQRSTRIIPKFNPVVKFLFASLLVITLTFFVGKIYAQVGVIENTKNAVKAGSGQEFWLHNALSSQIVSGSMILGGENIGDTDASGAMLPPGGTIGFTTNAIASLYKPQASGIQYIAQLKDNLLGKPAYAQSGIGFEGLDALLPIWKAFRNVVYLLSAFFFIIIGIMIMLRVKVSPQAVISVQNAIPQVIITLILVTFSYAIAGLLIDLSNFVLSLVIAILYSSKGITDFSEPLFSYKMFINPIDRALVRFSTLNDPSFLNVYTLSKTLAPSGILATLGAVIGAVIGGIVGSAPGAILGGLVGGAFFYLLVQIMIVIWLVKLFFGMMKCYVSILFKIILAPLEICLGAFPGSKVNFSTWLRDLTANLAVFPITIIFLIIVNLIIDRIKWNFSLWQPGVIDLGSGVLDVVTSASGGFVPVAIGLSALAILSKLPEMIPQYIFMIKPSPWGIAIGEGLKPENLPGIGGTYKNIKAGIDKSRQQKYADAYENALDLPGGPKERIETVKNKALTKWPRLAGLGRRRTPTPPADGEQGNPPSF